MGAYLGVLDALSLALEVRDPKEQREGTSTALPRTLRPADYPLYLRRKWRYARGGLQLEMLVNVLRVQGLPAMPAHVHDLYVNAPLPSRLRWVGLDTPLRLLAVLWIRSFRKRGLTF